MKSFYIGLFDCGFYNDDDGFSFWFDILRVVSGKEEEEIGASLFCIEKSDGELLVDLFFIHII